MRKFGHATVVTGHKYIFNCNCNAGVEDICGKSVEGVTEIIESVCKKCRKKVNVDIDIVNL